MNRRVRRWRPAEGVEFTSVEDEVVLLDPKSGKYFGLDAVGSLVWSGISRGWGLDEIIAEVHRNYDTEVAVIREDLETLFSRLLDLGLVVDEELEPERQ